MLLEPDDVDLDGEAADELEEIFDAELPDDDKDEDGDEDEDDGGIDDDEEDGNSAVDGEDPEDVDSGSPCVKNKLIRSPQAHSK